MAYTKTNWVNNGTPPLSAANLNNIENGIYNCDSRLTTVENVVGPLSSYSTTETAIGTWIDGKVIYRKVIDFGALPNATTKLVSSGLTMANVRILNMYGTAVNASGITFPINTVRPNSATYAIGTYCNENGYVVIDSGGQNRTGFTAYVVLEYIKTS